MTTKFSERRQRIFMMLTLLSPFLILGLIEGGLRLSGFGNSYPLFVEVKQAPGYLLANRQVMRRFLVDESDKPDWLWIRSVPFSRRKAPDTVRIFIQGESSAAGFPYFSLPAMLQQRLQSTFPKRRIEVITTAVAAITSYTLLDFTDEIIEQSPDAVLIYAGHNEYVGILGVGSRYSVGQWRPLVLAFLLLREVRLFQLVQRSLMWLKPDAKRIYQHGRSLMATVVRDREIPFGSEIYQRGIEQFRSNLNAILTRYQQAGVPVLIGTVASNERDQPPFINGHRVRTNVQVLQTHLDAGRKFLGEDASEEALAEFDKAVALDDSHAGAHFGRGQALDRLGRFTEARQAYLAAKDRDQLRFRAPEAINQVIREAALQHGAHLVDVQAALGSYARGKIIGSDLMLEHVHPNIRGYFLMANAFYEAFHQLGMIGPWTRPISLQKAWETLPVTEVERLYGEWAVQNLMSDWPFRENKVAFHIPVTINPAGMIATAYFRGRVKWPNAMRLLLEHYRRQGDFAEAAKVAVLLAEAFPYRVEDQTAAYELLGRVGRPEADIYLTRRRSIEKRKDALAAGP